MPEMETSEKAFRSSETWVDDTNRIAAVKQKGGGYAFFVHSQIAIGGTKLEDMPAVIKAINDLLNKMMKAQKEKS